MDYCLREGADIIVNTDGDNQYCGADIEKLVRPILEGRAELVIGDRQPGEIEHFSPTKRTLQKLGSRTVSRLANLDVPDVASGFKAYSREAAARIHTFGEFDHTVDHVIQAGRRRIPPLSVPIRTNEASRESRLFSSVGEFIARSLGVMVRVYSSYGAMNVFSLVGSLVMAGGILLGLRFVYFFLFTDHHSLHVQSLILAAILMLAGFQMLLTGIVADLINGVRGVLEDVSFRLRRLEAGERQPGRKRGIRIAPIPTRSGSREMTESLLIEEREGGVALLTLNRPDAMNALSAGLRDALATRFRSLQASAEVRVVILTGAGRAVSAGYDRKELAAGTTGESADSAASDMADAMAAFEGPIIGAINGHAITCLLYTSPRPRD